MGLDQYLYARKYVSSSDYGRDADGNYINTPNEKFSQILSAMDISTDEVRGDHPSLNIELSVGYWRKANAIHQWFVNEVQSGEDDCGDYYVSREQLIELRDLCQQVVDNPDDAEELLPTQGGFFFGETEYDEWYFSSVKNTIEILDKILNNSKFDEWDFKYTSSW
jgi:hypothetical protein